MLPLVVDLSGRRVVVIGAGAVGTRKVRQLIDAGAKVAVISSAIAEDLPDAIESLQVRHYQPGDLEDAFLVVSATGDVSTNDQIVAEAAERHLWINVVDDPLRSNFYFTAVYRDGDVIVSVSTSGSSPALAQWLRDHLRTVLPSGLNRVAESLRSERLALQAAGNSTEGRPWRERIERLIAELTTSSN